MQRQPENILALDVGDKRIGVAVCHVIARLPHPLTTLENGPDVFKTIQGLIESNDVRALVVGLPRGMQGQSTDQTHKIEGFVEQLEKETTVPVYLMDEALTSHVAEQALQGTAYEKGDIDALAATYILNDFLTEHVEIFE